MKLKNTTTIWVTTLLIMIGCLQNPVLHAQQPFKLDENGIPIRLNPPVAISDFANVIDDDIQAKYEAELRQLEKETSIAIVIVTVPTFGDKYPGIEEYAHAIFKGWGGIGHVGSNEGLLIVFSMKEHLIRAQTGTGLEGFLTDAQCGQINRDHIAIHFKAGDMRGGFDDGINTYIQFVKTQIPDAEKREQIRKQHAEEKRISDAKTQDTIQSICIVLVVALLFALLIFLYRRAQKKAKAEAKRKEIERQKEELRRNNEEAKKLAQGKAMQIYDIVAEKIASINPAMVAAKAIHDTYPTWAQTQASQHREEIRKLMNEMNTELEKAKGMISADPIQALDIMENLSSRYRQAETAYQKTIENLPKKIQFFNDNATQKQEEALDTVKKLGDMIKTLQGKGYLIFADDQKVYELLQQEGIKLGEYQDTKTLYDKSNVLLDKANKQMISIDAELQVVKDNKNKIGQLRTKATKDIPEFISSTNLLLVYLIQNSVKDLWSVLQGNMTRAQQGFADLSDKLKIAEEYNNMKTQKFAEGAALLQSIQDQINRNSSLLQTIVDQHHSWTEATAALPALYDTAKARVATALQTIKDSDVGSNARESAKNAVNQLEGAKSELNAIKKTDALNKTIQTAQYAIDKAKSDIRQAEDARDEKRREAERETQRRRDNEARAAAALIEETNRQSSWNKSNNDNNSGGFGGFGGGSDDGGGATTSW